MNPPNHFTKEITLSALRSKLEELIHVTGWPEEKQQLWLRKQGYEAWGDAPSRVLTKAVEKLAMSAKMFGASVDTDVTLVQDEDCDGLDVYTE